MTAEATNGVARPIVGKVSGATSHETVMIPFSDIVAVEDDNGRTVYEDVDQLADSIKAAGRLITPLELVRMPGDQLRLLDGFRRYRALKLLKWGKKPVPATICEYDNDSSVYVAGLIHNTTSRKWASCDLAARVRLLVEQFDVPRDELCLQSTITKKYLDNLIRADKQICDDVKRIWRKKDVPMRTILDWAALDEDKQIRACEEWEAERDEEGKKAKSAPASRGPKKKGDAEKGHVDPDGNVWQTPEAVMDKLEELRGELSELDQDAPGASVRYEALKNKLAGLRWVTGELTRL
jgi:ParB-like chromosome segregation protein Spo0J